MNSNSNKRQLINEIINEKEIAIAGVSRNPKKFGNVVYKTLKEKGYTVYPVNPNAENFEGEKSYKSVKELPSKVKNLIILLKPNEVPDVVDQSIEKGIAKIWLQQGSTNRGAIEKARNSGVEMVTNKCILMYTNPNGIHKFHAGINKFFGKY